MGFYSAFKGLKYPESLLSLNMGRNLPIHFIPSNVLLNICKFIISLRMRPPHNKITSKLLPCSTSHTPVTDGHHMTVQIITFFVICYSSPITLHYKLMANLKTACHNSKKMHFILNKLQFSDTSTAI